MTLSEVPFPRTPRATTLVSMKSISTTKLTDLLNFLAPRPFNEVAAFMGALSDAVNSAKGPLSLVHEDVLNGLMHYMKQLPYEHVSGGIQWVSTALTQPDHKPASVPNSRKTKKAPRSRKGK